MMEDGTLKTVCGEAREMLQGGKHFVSCATSDAGLELLSGMDGIDHNSGSYRELENLSLKAYCILAMS